MIEGPRLLRRRQDAGTGKVIHKTVLLFLCRRPLQNGPHSACRPQERQGLIKRVRLFSALLPHHLAPHHFLDIVNVPELNLLPLVVDLASVIHPLLVFIRED